MLNNEVNTPGLYALLVPKLSPQSCQTPFPSTATYKGLDYVCIEWRGMFCSVRGAAPGDQAEGGGSGL